MPTCCPTSSAARPGRVARIRGAAVRGRSAPNTRARAIRSTTPGSKPARAAGFPVTDDYNGKQQEGFGRGQYTIRDGYRSSAATAYLRPARKRGAISTSRPARMPRACCCRARAPPASNMSRTAATPCEVEAGREVILCGGAFNTPPLLMLSGIGPAGHLARHRHQAGGRSAGRQEPAGSPRRHRLLSAPRRRARSTARCASTAWRSA